MNEHQNIPSVSGEAAEFIEAFVDHLRGQGEFVNVADLTDDVFDEVEGILPLVAGLVDIAQDADDAVETPEIRELVAALGIVAADGETLLWGDRLRRGREQAGLSTEQLASAISDAGLTIAASDIEAMESELVRAVAQRLGDLAASILELESGYLSGEPMSADPDVDVIDAILEVEPAANVWTDSRAIATLARRPDAAVWVAHIGVEVVLCTYRSVTDRARLWDDEVIAAARLLLSSHPSLSAVGIVAGDSERSTQIVDVADLDSGFAVPSGRRLLDPRRPVLPVRTAIAGLFDELMPTWGADDTRSWFVSEPLDLSTVIADAAEKAIVTVKSATVRLPEKVEAKDSIGNADIEALTAFITELQTSLVSADEAAALCEARVLVGR